jgi:phosphomannomutase
MAVKLSFGTAGIRARLGEADDQLNLRTVQAVAHALMDYVCQVTQDARERGVCVGYDGRRQSAAFARRIQAVALAHGFRVRAFELPVPTPLLAHATARHSAALGLMVTASHNPPEDNGIKVYWLGGAQILPPHDAEIARRIAAVDPDRVPLVEIELARGQGRLSTLGAEEQAAYLDAVSALVPLQTALRVPALAYSALCGVGGPLTRELAARRRVQLLEVAAQAEPRADFGGLASPNPEHPAALAELRALAELTRAELAACHDPDADRLALLARGADGRLESLSGDELGALLLDYVLSLEPAPERCAVVSTLVSGTLAERVARARGAHYERTLTGFKWIAQRGRARERELKFLFGYEEALGYCFGALGDDKDGIAALCVLFELVRALGARGRSLHDGLEELARRHGLFRTRQVTLSAQGAEGQARVQAISSLLRTAPPEDLLGPGATREDYLTRPERADLLVLRAPQFCSRADPRASTGARLCVRPSGTEAKLKFYLEVEEPVQAQEPLADARDRAEAALDRLGARIDALSSSAGPSSPTTP